MRKRIKKVGCIFLSAVILLIFSVYSSAQEAAVYANQTLEVWNSNENRVAYRTSNVSIYCVSEVDSSTLTVSNMRNYISAAQSAWSDLGLTYSWASSANGSSIYVRAVELEVVENLGADAFTMGMTYLPEESITYRGLGYFGTAVKDICEITGGIQMYLVENGRMVNNSSYCRSITAHEFGHALGYYGHFTDSSGLMYVNSLNLTATAPNLAEKQHLCQIYEEQT